KKSGTYNLNVDEPTFWLENFQATVAVRTLNSDIIDKAYFRYLPRCLCDDDQVWFYSERKNDDNHDWSAFAAKFIKHFNKKKRANVKDVLTKAWDKKKEESLYDFLEAKAKLAKEVFPEL